MHHPIFLKFERFHGYVDGEYSMDFLGIKTKKSFYEFNHIESRVACPGYPPFSEEYLEWVDVLESVWLAKNNFVMIELGAGWGRWISRAFGALRQLHPDMPYVLIGVEAEPTHFQWMKEHCQDNGIEHVKLIEAAVDEKDGQAKFHFGNPSEWYGQCIGGKDTVRAIALKTILKDFAHVDLIDLDVQNFEFKILNAARDDLHKVKRIHIGTHSVEVEKQLRGLFGNLKWECLCDFTLMSKHETEYGTASFNDGIQTWINPLFISECDRYPLVKGAKP